MLIELSPLGLIKVPGAAAEKFLQGQVTCDAQTINATHSSLGAHCDHKGRIQAIFRLFKYQDDYYLQLPRALIPATLLLLKKYAVFFKINLEDASPHWTQIGLSGTEATEQLTTLFGPAPTQIDEVFTLENLIIIRMPDTQPRFVVIAAPSIIAEKFSTSIAAYAQWKLLDIQAGIPTVYPESVGLFTPHQLNLHLINGVSFTKGCYTGQEIIARMQYLGKLKQQMYRVQFTCDDLPLPGTQLYNETGQEIGELVDMVFVSATNAQALVVLANNALGHTIYLGKPNGTVLQLTNLPYTAQTLT